ncbi:MAG: NTP transferase domain-containing protein [Actinobacteria bacterium]|nr:NTP transferase domain-containing protein [Actinomycetota bacterium]
MQAIVLVGGKGTRLRPLTDSVPKPALTLVDRPFLAYMVEWLGTHGVTEAVLACGFLPDQLREALGEGEHEGVKLTYVTEPDRRGTAGAIRFAAEALGEDRAAARPRGARGAGDDRALRGRGLLSLRPRRLRHRGGGPRLSREDRRGCPRRGQRRRLRARA